MTRDISKFLKEPFVQFLLIGAAIFAATYLFAPPPDEEDIRIVISEPTVRAMKERLVKYSGGKLSEDEINQRLNQEIELKIHEEILYREGLARGLDRDDSVVKSRVAAVMERFARGTASTEPFGEEAIERYYRDNQTQFTKPERISFGQVLFSAEKRGKAQALADCKAVLARIQSGELKEFPDLEKLGDPDSAIRSTYRNITPDRAKSIFGDTFIRDLGNVDQPGVVAPVESKYGYHIVLVQQIVPSELKPLDQIRDRIVQKLDYDRKTASFDAFYESVKDNYEVTVEDGR